MLETDGQTLAVDAKALGVDVPAFERLTTDATADALARAVALYEGDLLDGVRVDEPPFEEWLLGERERLREMAVDALTRLLAQQMQEPATERAIQTALRLVAIEPVQESVHRALMRLYARQGRRGAALRQYQHCVAIVQRELGAEPERETRQLYQEILQRQSAEASRTSGTPAPASPPVVELPPQETPLVGRQPELARLRAALDDAVAKRGRVVIVLGEAGIGKSRMVAGLGELASQRGARMLVGHAFQTEQVLTFGPWVDGLRAAHLSADAAVLGSIDPISRAELGCLLPELAAGSAPAVSSGPDHLRLFEAVARLLAALSADAPLVLAIEDAHWADDMTVRLLAFVARRIRTARALLIVTAREEELATASVLRQALDELRDEPHAQSLSLGALSKSDTIALVRRLVGPGRDADRSELLEQSIWRTSEGNPFMIVETVRALGEGMHVHSPAGLLLPERVRQVIVRRLEGLGHVARDVVAVAAVIGREFDFTLLQRAAALDEATTAEGLEELVRRRIVHGVSERFDFTHDRIREVAYRELLVPRRRRLHAQIAAALEDVGRGRLEEHYAALALHAREGEQWDRADRYLYLAGRQAIAYGNYGQARLFFEDAAVAIARGAGDPSLELDVYLELWVTAIEGGTPSDLETLEGKVDALARALDDRPRLAQWRVRQAQALWNVWDRERALESAVERAREAVALAPADDLRTRAYSHFIAGAASADLGRPAEAVAEFDRGAGLFAIPAGGREAVSDLALPIYVSLAAWRSDAQARRGDFPAALGSAQDALAVADRIGSHPARAFARAFLGRVHLHQGELERARPVLVEGLAIGEEHGFVHGIVPNALSLANCELMLGRADGIAHLERALTAGASIGTLMATWTAYGAITAATYRAAGRLVDAETVIARGIALATLRGAQGHLPTLLRERAEIRLAQRRVTEALGDGGGALQLADQMGLEPEQARCHVLLGHVHQAAGDRDRARRHLQSARERLGALGMRHWLGEAEKALAALDDP